MPPINHLVTSASWRMASPDSRETSRSQPKQPRECVYKPPLDTVLSSLYQPRILTLNSPSHLEPESWRALLRAALRQSRQNDGLIKTRLNYNIRVFVGLTNAFPMRTLQQYAVRSPDAPTGVRALRSQRPQLTRPPPPPEEWNPVSGSCIIGKRGVFTRTFPALPITW
jgi:hypothetical protein